MVFLAVCIAICVAVLSACAYITLHHGPVAKADTGPSLSEIPFNGQRAFDDMKRLCDIGPRRSGSQAMLAQRTLIVDHFTKLGQKVELQKFSGKYPADGPDVNLIGTMVPMANIIVHIDGESKTRVLLCGHYDTLPFPLHDTIDRKGVFVGANDNAGGVAILMELGRQLAAKKPPVGVDLVFFDGEEMIFSEDDPFFLGSEFFARELVKHPPPQPYRYGVLLDMVSNSGLQLYEEANSVKWDDTEPLVKQIWATAKRLGVKEFIDRPKHEVRDDHLALHDIAKIPTCDLIDFDYAPWHTRGDTPDKLSPLSMARVGWVLSEWLKEQGSKESVK